MTTATNDPGTATELERSTVLERRGLLASGAMAGAIATIGIIWGFVADSQIIVFDGFYAVIGLGLSWLGLRSSKLIAAGPTDLYPFGRETLGPLMVTVQGLVLLGSLGYAGLEAVQTLLSGGEAVEAGLALAYAMATLIACVAIALVLRKLSHDSELLEAEIKQWWAGAVLAIVMLIGFAAAFALDKAGHGDVAAYVDPVLMLVAILLLSPAPIGMLRTSMRELLEGAAPPLTVQAVDAAVTEVRATFDLPQPSVRVGKLGRKLYVEIDFLLDDDTWTVRDADRVRRALMHLLERPGQVLWLNVEFHVDPHWDD